MPCFITPLNLLSRPTAALKAELGSPLLAGSTRSDVRHAWLSCSVTAVLSKSCHLRSCSSPQGEEQWPPRKAVLSVNRDPGGKVRNTGPGTGRLTKDSSQCERHSHGWEGVGATRAPGGPSLHPQGLVTCARQIWGSGSRAESLGLFAPLRQTTEGWRWTLHLAGQDETCYDGQAVP